jgi:hypothetical protein
VVWCDACFLNLCDSASSQGLDDNVMKMVLPSGVDVMQQLKLELSLIIPTSSAVIESSIDQCDCMCGSKFQNM